MLLLYHFIELVFQISQRIIFNVQSKNNLDMTIVQNTGPPLPFPLLVTKYTLIHQIDVITQVFVCCLHAHVFVIFRWFITCIFFKTTNEWSIYIKDFSLI